MWWWPIRKSCDLRVDRAALSLLLLLTLVLISFHLLHKYILPKSRVYFENYQIDLYGKAWYILHNNLGIKRSITVSTDCLIA